MRTKNDLKTTLRTAVLGLSIFLLAVGLSFGQQQVNLTAGPTSLTLPDGTAVPMWGYSCGAVVTGSTATCAKLNPAATGWSPVVITVPTGQTLQINLTNSLTFGANGIPTSLTIVGQLGGGLGTARTTTLSPTHNPQGATWPVGDPTVTNTPPPQGPRVQSLATEVASGATTSLTWTTPREGTYLIESGTHPSIQGPMGLYGMLVVTAAPAGVTPGTAYGSGATAVSYNAEVPLLFSEIDPVQNNAVNTAVNTTGFSETRVWSGQPGQCGNPSSPVGVVNTCYPPAVNYTPVYYLVNGVAFDKTHATASLFPSAPAIPTTGGSLLVRIVNAGLRMHVPSIVGAQTNTPAVPGFSLIAEDGNPLPGVHRVQSEVFMAAGKTYDVMINSTAAGASIPVFDRQLSLSANKTARDAGMLAFIGNPVTDGTTVTPPALPAGAVGATAAATPDTYNSVVAGKTLVVSDPAKGVIANDVNVYGVKVSGAAPAGLTLNADGTFTYSGGVATSFTYCGNGTTSGAACALVTLGLAPIEAASGITVVNDSYPNSANPSNLSTHMSIKPPGVLANDTDAAGYPLTAELVSASGVTVTLNPDGGFTATVAAHNNTVAPTFTYRARNSQGTLSAGTATVTLTFQAPSNLAVTLVDGATKTALASQDYRWIIEEDRTFYVDPNCQQNPLPAGCASIAPGKPAIFGTNFHTSYMPVVAQGCTGPLSCESGQSVLGVPAACDVGNGVCRSAASKTPVLPGDVHLDPTKRYYISVLPGDGIGLDATGADTTAHTIGGASIAPGQTALNVIVQPEQQQAAKLSVFVFEDDHPLNGEHDAGGGIDTLSPNEPGLGGFNITIQDLVGMSGDSAGQMTYDEFNQPLSNALAGTVDPTTGLDSCPVSKDARVGVYTGDPPQPANGTVSDSGITGVIPVCPKFESDGATLSPLAGQAIVLNVPPGRYGVVATPAADRIARGEEWLQTNTLDGGKDLEAFIKNNEPAYFQEYGPASFHVSIGFANPKWINDVGHGLCNGPGAPACTQTVTGKVTGARMSRTPDERLYSSGTRDLFSYTQCYVSLGSVDGADIAFTKCADDGTFSLPGIPAGDWRITVFDQWNDQIVDGISTPVRVGSTTNPTLCPGPNTNASTCDMGDVGVHGWKNNLYTRTFFDANGDGISQDTETGLALVPTNIRYRDGSISNLNSTDLEGFAGFNEVFPIFNWYVLETDSTRYKTTGIHVVNDAGGPVDGSAVCGTAGFPACGNSTLLAYMARTMEDFPLPANLRVPGAVYCGGTNGDSDCTGFSIANGPGTSATTNLGTGRIDPPWVTSYGWQSYMGQNQYLEFGKKPFNVGENGGIRGHVVYASTRPFDDPALLLQLTWEPQVPHVTINLYQEGFAADGVTPILHLVDTTTTSSWDDFAQGFRSDGVPNMNCPGQSTTDLFYPVTLQNQPNYLDWYNSQHGGAAVTPLPANSQYKCYDGMHNWNQLQPAPYDGAYQFPSVTGIVPTTGKPAGTNCHMATTAEPWGCVPNPSSSSPTSPTYDPYRAGLPMLQSGKYVVEMIVPPGYELVKEEDKNILLGDAYTAPVTQQFAGFGNIFIMPDQASVAAFYNANNPLIPNTNEGVTPRHEGDTGSVETFWPCVGALRVVPDYMSLFPGSGQNAPFAGATRPLCDRKEVVLEDQMSVLAKFYVFTSTHVAAKFTGIITDDFTAEFDPFSPAFGEKFSPANLPVSVKDWSGTEITRVYSDEFGIFNGLTYSSWSVNPPDPSGYIPQMMVMCMNDRGSGTTADPLYQSSYSQFCYEWSFMPGQTSYLDTPVIPTAAFAPNYNHPDCNYPNATPAIAEVDGDGIGPWVSATGRQLTITALGDQLVDSYAYSGPGASTTPFNLKKITRHYGFGATRGTGSVTIGGVNATVVSWSDTQIVVTVPATLPLCAVQQQAQYGGSQARCGELVITAGNGKKSVDTVIVTAGGKAPTHVDALGSIQAAIDAAAPGDLIIVDPTCSRGNSSNVVSCSSPGNVTKSPSSHHELVLMWKPVRLQGVGAASSTIDANAHPSGILSDWRLRVACLFGIAPTGVPAGYDATCGSGWFEFRPTLLLNGQVNNAQVDRLPLESVVGWDAGLNGNLAEMLQEPSLMGAYEGAGITVLSKGVAVPAGVDPWSDGATPAAFPAGTTLLQNVPGVSVDHCSDNPNPYPSNFQCNPSRIDGLSITNSSQGGGGIFVHAWGHNLEISNNRIYNNQGTLAGGISVGQGEHPGAYTQVPAGGVANAVPGSCQTSTIDNTQLPFCFDRFVNIHHNAVTMDASEGDELFSATPSGAGGIAVTSGVDNYKVNDNWVCGNLSTGDGAGISQLGFAYNGDIEHNSILFNQATNPTTPSNGGGLLIMSAPDTDPTCPGEPDADCNHAYGTVGDGIGPGLVVNANLIMGNAAEAGAGGGIRFQAVNGIEVSTFPNNPERWYTVNVTNNIITNNVAGWDGGGVSLQDSIGVNLINNTIISNDSTASSGTLFGAFFANQASAPTPCPRDAVGANIPCVPLSTPQPAGLSSAGHTAEFLASLPASITCPTGHYAGTTAVNGSCRAVSYPILYNDVFWQNRAFNIVVTQPTTGSGAQQSTVTLVPTLNQSATGACVTTGANFWDIGLRGDTGATNHDSGFTFTPEASVLTSIAGYPGGGTGFRVNTASFSPGVVKQYCNGSKVPPEAGAGAWYQVPPGTNEGNVPVPIFSLTAGATVDEGNNWINISWGPLSLINPTTETNPAVEAVLGDYSLASGSTAIGYITNANSATTFAAAPADDFFGTLRKTDNAVDAGAVEFTGVPGGGGAIASVTPTSLTFGNQAVGTTSATQNLTLHNTGTATLTGITVVVSAPFTRVTTGPFPAGAGNCGATLAAGANCTIKVAFAPTAAGAAAGTVTITASVTVTGSPVSLTGTGVVPAPGANLTPATWSPTATRGIGLLGPIQIFTLTNTGTAPLTGITQATLGGASPGDYAIIRLASTCGPAGGGQLLGQTTLAPGASCVVSVQFRPLLTDPAGSVRNATVSVTDVVGTQTSTLSGTAQ